MATRSHTAPASKPPTPLRKEGGGGSATYTGQDRTKFAAQVQKQLSQAVTVHVVESKKVGWISRRTPRAQVEYEVSLPESDLKMLVPEGFLSMRPGAQRKELNKAIQGVKVIAGKPVPVKRAETAETAKPKALPGWKKLLEKSLQGQARTLQSEDFLSVAEAAPLLGIEDAAVRRRIREGKLLALKHPAGGEQRVPIWATAISSADTKALTDLGGDSLWDLYQFMEAPHGAMKALRPCDLLVAPEHLPVATRGARDALAASLKANGSTLLALVLKALKEHVSREA